MDVVLWLPLSHSLTTVHLAEAGGGTESIGEDSILLSYRPNVSLYPAVHRQTSSPGKHSVLWNNDMLWWIIPGFLLPCRKSVSYVRACTKGIDMNTYYQNATMDDELAYCQIHLGSIPLTYSPRINARTSYSLPHHSPFLPGAHKAEVLINFFSTNSDVQA